MTQNKNHWYDGWFYDKFIAPNQDRLFSEIKKIIEPNSTVIDVGCGTGRFSFSVADGVNKVVGIDLSKKNIDKANQTFSKNSNERISFLHTNLSTLISQNFHFDYAVMTYVIHEVNEEDRINLIKELSQIADKIIIGDYLTPKPGGFWSALNEVVEFAAGNEHYRNYKNYVRKGGLQDLADKAELKIIKEIKNKPSTSYLVMLMK
ncbi:MAG: class I SAM-dependent methyltransferase [Ignavibacteriales bacterium]|nr:class I SAM-dependent methyltransferase [Ignavibacteriales bacterium]